MASLSRDLNEGREEPGKGGLRSPPGRGNSERKGPGWEWSEHVHRLSGEPVSWGRWRGEAGFQRGRRLGTGWQETLGFENPGKGVRHNV